MYIYPCCDRHLDTYERKNVSVEPALSPLLATTNVGTVPDVDYVDATKTASSYDMILPLILRRHACPNLELPAVTSRGLLKFTHDNERMQMQS